jgi:hypothetical protein
MRGKISAVLIGLALAAAACSAGEATGGVGTLDAAATRACSELEGIVQARAAGGLAPGDLRERIALVYQAAQGSSNPVIRARALSLFADSTTLAAGGEAQLDSDLQDMRRACSGTAE